MAKGAGSAARAIIEDERDAVDQNSAVTWQRDQALDTWARMKAGDRSEVSKADLDADFDAALNPSEDRTA